MCLIVFAWRPGHPQPLIVAANRDEFYARPSLPLAHWDDRPGVYAGRDLKAGGTWLGISDSGRFAALTNIRDMQLPQGGPSRGELVADFLHGRQTAEEYLSGLSARAAGYAGFNLLLGNAQQLWHFNQQQGTAQQLPAGLYGLSNADLDSPWPKLQRAKAALANCLAEPQTASLLNLLQDAQPAADADLPDTGVGVQIERLLSSVFIASPGYGTCASTALIVHQDGRRQIAERRFGPAGVLLGETCLVVRQAQAVEA
ncbi:NRDE family protein [Pseudomonas sp. N040]|uniref:NRDE family protein n=1 Tax=Pseudomonas sp. N040 TaxID=2785325 RepID=UPI0018A29980|nr:NRDE family protein [Pseudomonas sp. N040]MBF7730009.1 NRDE family protein [Pseudomonas sp. N040]MBW7013651.1 NRDE family protein [Pseudomonas sp. N040]